MDFERIIKMGAFREPDSTRLYDTKCALYIGIVVNCLFGGSGAPGIFKVLLYQCIDTSFEMFFRFKGFGPVFGHRVPTSYTAKTAIFTAKQPIVVLFCAPPSRRPSSKHKSA